MSYLRVPEQIWVKDIREKKYSLSPGMYRRVVIPTSNVKSIGDLLERRTNGLEVGSLAYVSRSTYKFVRTKALQEYANLTQLRTDSFASIKPQAYIRPTDKNPHLVLHDGDVLYARGGSVGEVAIADGCGTATFCSHLIKLEFNRDALYCYSFMKHPICKLQQQPDVKGAIRSLDNFSKETLLRCLIPFPNQGDADRAIQYVTVLMQAIVVAARIQ